jgi:hypothetical protein
VQQALGRDPHCGDLYVFRGRKADLVKIVSGDMQNPSGDDVRNPATPG